MEERVAVVMEPPVVNEGQEAVGDPEPVVQEVPVQRDVGNVDGDEEP